MPEISNKKQTDNNELTDKQFNMVADSGIKDGQLYKMAGNAVSVPVISALGQIIKNIWEEKDAKLCD